MNYSNNIYNDTSVACEHHEIIAVELQAHGRTSDRDVSESFVLDADGCICFFNSAEY